MKRLFLIAVFLLLVSAGAYGQGPSVAVRTVTALTSGAGACRANAQYTEIVELRAGGASDGFYRCKNDQSGWQGPFADAASAAPSNATYITQTPNATLTNEQALSLLATGIPLVTTGTGVISISNVTNDVQTKASIVPNTAPSAGQILAGNAGGTAYAPVSLSQDCTITSLGVVTCLKTNNVLFGALATVTPGTGVATALAVNVGTAGAFVVNGGALGLPSSGTGTNIVGIPAANILAGSFGAGAYVISTSLQAATIELGAATDTTLSRVSAGVIAVEGVNVLTSGATGVQTFLNTPSSANLAAALTDETGTGASVFANSATLVTALTLTDATSGTTKILEQGTNNENGHTTAFMMAANNAVPTTSNVSIEADSVAGANADFAVRTGGAGTALGTIRLKVDSLGVVYMPSLGTSSAATTGTVCWTTSTGLVNVDTTTTCLLSSAKYKQNDRPLIGGLKTVLRLRPISYFLKHDPYHIGEQEGFFAEDVFKVDPRLVSLEADGSPHAVRYQQMSAQLALAIQELNAKVEAQRKEISKLKAKVSHHK